MARSKASLEPDEEDGTRTRILDAATQCFRQLGIAKTSLSDVARVAGLSRGTVYRYFGDREGLIAAVVDSGTDQYFGEVAVAMDKRTTLAKQLAAYAETAVRTAVEHQSYNRLLSGDTGLMRVIMADAETSFWRSVDFLVPYVRAGKERGEVGPEVDEVAAAEWLARLMLTITSTSTSVAFDVRNPRSVGRFVERFAVDGLLGRA